ncbi:hypothetical protein [Burkholderia dolosa]|uniref:hypothetical protein n=1 Tax=Burkholderia dolosa TaxID=152500 RepID=UPI0027D32DFC|nr:hypothetical protein [Burkholderia dolosa]
MDSIGSMTSRMLGEWRYSNRRQYRRAFCRAQNKTGAEAPVLNAFFGVADGTRTHDNRNHKLYTLIIKNNGYTRIMEYVSRLSLFGMGGMAHLPEKIRITLTAPVQRPSPPGGATWFAHIGRPQFFELTAP